MQLVRTNMFVTGIFAPHLLFIAAATADREVVCVCVCLESHPPYVRYSEINDAEREGNTSYNSIKKTRAVGQKRSYISKYQKQQPHEHSVNQSLHYGYTKKIGRRIKCSLREVIQSNKISYHFLVLSTIN